MHTHSRARTNTHTYTHKTWVQVQVHVYTHTLSHTHLLTTLGTHTQADIRPVQHTLYTLLRFRLCVGYTVHNHKMKMFFYIF